MRKAGDKYKGYGRHWQATGRRLTEKAADPLSMKNPARWFAVFTVATIFLLTGCKKANLPLDFEVENAIVNSGDFNTPESVLLARELRLKFDSLQIKDSYEDADYAEWLPMDIVLKGAGLVNIEVERMAVILADDFAHNIKVTLTLDGQILSSQWQKEPQVDDKNFSRTFIPGYTIPIAKRKFVAVKRANPLADGKAKVEFTWRWEATLSGKAFDVSNPAYQSLSPLAKRCAERFNTSFDSSKTESSIAIFQLEKKDWRFVKFESPLQ
jgi:hypothetical protein